MQVMGRGIRLEQNGHEWEINKLLYADDTVLIADSEESLQRLVNVFGEVCWRRKLQVNVAKSKVMVMSRGGAVGMNVHMNGERMEQAECFRYLGSDMHESGRMNEETGHRVTAGEKVEGALRAVWRNKRMTMDAMKGMYEATVVPTVLYGSETWVMNTDIVSRVEAVALRCMRSMCRVTKFDRVSTNRSVSYRGFNWDWGKGLNRLY